MQVRAIRYGSSPPVIERAQVGGSESKKTAIGKFGEQFAVGNSNEYIVRSEYELVVEENRYSVRREYYTQSRRVLTATQSRMRRERGCSESIH